MEILDIAVDFDGTVVEHKFPDIGEDVEYAVVVLKKLIARDHRLILWTMRGDHYLDAAVDWFIEHDIELHGIQRNPNQSWTNSPKAYANIYIDDAALGAPLKDIPGAKKCIDWYKVEELLIERGVLNK